ncbi:MAG TPA: hypothetical protein VM840_10235 [Actinomycetota bacterium]|nr:hypothetical protein [Actinomycetota bacterium]
MRAFHGWFAYVVIALNLGVGLWGLVWVRRRMSAPRSFLALVLAGQSAVAVQVVTGVAYMRQLGQEPGFHSFYGFVILIAAILSWAFRGEDPRRAVTVLSVVALFIGAVAIRGLSVAGR